MLASLMVTSFRSHRNYRLKLAISAALLRLEVLEGQVEESVSQHVGDVVVAAVGFVDETNL